MRGEFARACFDEPMTDRISSAELIIDAPAARIFELIADPALQVTWDGNRNLAVAATGQRVRRVGDVFVMTLTKEMGDRQNRIVEFDEGRLIAWRPSEIGKSEPGHLWRWELEPLDPGRTLVRHTYDWTELTDPNRFGRARTTTPERLTRSLLRLREVATAPLIRPAMAGEAAELSELIIRSKGHWGYDEQFLDDCRDELRVHESSIAAGELTVADVDGQVAGCAWVQGYLLFALFVDPPYIGRGVGKALLRAVLSQARADGKNGLFLEADPFAVPFYDHMGGALVGYVASQTRPGRMLPRYFVAAPARQNA